MNMLFLHVPGRSKTTLLLLSHRDSMGGTAPMNDPLRPANNLYNHLMICLSQKYVPAPVHLSQRVGHPASRDDNGHSKFRLPLTQ